MKKEVAMIGYFVMIKVVRGGGGKVISCRDFFFVFLVRKIIVWIFISCLLKKSELKNVFYFNKNIIYK